MIKKKTKKNKQKKKPQQTNKQKNLSGIRPDLKTHEDVGAKHIENDFHFVVDLLCYFVYLINWHRAETDRQTLIHPDSWVHYLNSTNGESSYFDAQSACNPGAHILSLCGLFRQ